MLGQFWLLAILVSLTLGVPLSRESGTPSLTLVPLSDTKVSYGPKKMGLNRANKASWNFKSMEDQVGGKAISNGLGTQSLGSYSALSTGVGSSRTSGGTSYGPKKMGLNRANIPSWNLKDAKNRAGSKTIFEQKGVSSVGGSLAYSTGVSHSGALGGT